MVLMRMQGNEDSTAFGQNTDLPSTGSRDSDVTPAPHCVKAASWQRSHQGRTVAFSSDILLHNVFLHLTLINL